MTTNKFDRCLEPCNRFDGLNLICFHNIFFLSFFSVSIFCCLRSNVYRHCQWTNKYMHAYVKFQLFIEWIFKATHTRVSYIYVLAVSKIRIVSLSFAYEKFSFRFDSIESTWPVFYLLNRILLCLCLCMFVCRTVWTP